MRPIAAAAVLLCALSFASAPALACKGKHVLYHDDFRKVDPLWDKQEWFSIGSGRAKMTPDIGKALTVVLNGVTFDQADICADVVMADPADPQKPFAGVVFWVEDYANLYGFMISAAGTAAIIRIQDRKWVLPVRWRTVPGLQTRPGSVNTLRITINGNSATTYINEQTFVTFTGQSPKDGGYIGFHGESEQNRADTWAFGNLTITEP
jgi:hypothetical protein